MPGGPVVAIFGPTASGKSAVAEAVAARTPARLVSADAMQVYRGVPILTNQPATPTALVAIWPLTREASVVDYAHLAHAEIDGALAAGLTPVVVGGTGLYLRAALAELDVPPAPAPGARERWSDLYETAGAEAAHAELARRDQRAAAAVHPNDRRRVVRALELAEIGATLVPETNRLWTEELRHPGLVVGLDVPTAALEERIVRRTQAMFERGVVAEARQALAGELSATAAKVLGLREAATLEPPEAIAAIARRTRQYAAYQRKWMRRIPGLRLLDGTRDPDDLADAVLEMARARQRLPGGRAG